MSLDPKLVEINEKLRIIGKQKLALKGRQRRLERITKTGGNFFTDAFSKVKNEFVNPDSKLRQTVVKPVEEVVNKTKNEFENPESKLRKEIVPRFDITKTDLSNYPNSAKKTMETTGNLPVVSVEIVRTPLTKAINTLIQLLSGGKFDKAKENAGYDNLFHLQLVLNVKDSKGNLKKISIQKTERVQVDGHLYGVNEKTEYLHVNIGSKAFTANEMLEKTRKRMGDTAFFGYDSFKNNCQNFVLNLLNSEGLAGSKEKAFLYQDTAKIAKEIPEFNKKIMNFTTDAGNVFSKLLGKGSARGGMKHDKETEEKIEKYLNEIKDEWAKLHEGHDDIPDDSLVNLVQSELNDPNLRLPDELIPILQSFINKHFDNDDVETKLKFIIRFMFNHNKKQVAIFPKTWKKIYEKLGLSVQKVPNEDPNSIMNIQGLTSNHLVSPWSYIPKFEDKMDDYNNEMKNKDKKIVIGIGKPKRGRPKKGGVFEQETEHRRIGGMVLKLMEMDRQHKMGGSKANEKIIKRHAKMIADEIDTYNKKFGGNWFTDTFNKVKDAVVSTANKVGNEFTNPDSVLRKTASKVGNEFTNPSSIFRSQVLAPVERSFEKFGKDTKEAFEDIGNKIKNEFTNSDSELARAFKPLTDTIGNEDWWKKTMTTPDTYILLITIALDVANMAGVPGAGLASQATKMIGDLAQGRKVSVADLANLALAMIPTPKVPGSQGIFNQIKSQVIGNSGMSAVARSQLIGRNIVKVGKELAGDAKVGFGEMEENGKKYKLHAIVINKKNFDKNDAVLEAVKYGSKKGMFMRETKQSFRFRNIPKTKFIPKSYRTKKIGKTGVSLIYGELK